MAEACAWLAETEAELQAVDSVEAEWVDQRTTKLGPTELTTGSSPLVQKRRG